MFKRFLTNVKAFQFFHLSRQGFSILTSILLTKTYLTTASIGQYEQLLFINFTLSFFWISGLIQGLLTLFPKQDKAGQGRFYWNSYLLFVGLSSLLLGVLLFGKPWILQALIGVDDLPYYELFAFYLWINLPTYLLENYFLLCNKRIEIIAFALFAFGLRVIAVIAPLLLGWPFEYSFWGLIILASAKHIWLVIFIVQQADFKLDQALVKNWVITASPLVAYSFLAGINQAFDPWLVNYLFDGDEEQFALFRYGAQEFPLALAMAGAFSAAMLPEVSKNLEQGLVDIKLKSLKLLHILFPISIVLMLSSWYWFPLVFNKAFQGSAMIFNIFLLILTNRLIFSHTILISLEENRIILYFVIGGLATNILLSLILGQWYGLQGIAWGTVLAFALEKALQVLYLHRRFQINLMRYVPVRWYLGYVVILIISYFVALNWM